MRVRWVAAVAAFVAFTPLISASQKPSLPPHAALHPLLADVQPQVIARLNAHPGLGIVIGLIDQTGKRWILTAGTAGENEKRPLDADTLFEIGSMTKVFTSALLAEMVQRGEVALTDPVSRYLPATVRVPARNGRQITLADLSTHTSGLPRLPVNMDPRDPDNPYADYTAQRMYDFLAGYELTRDIGAQYEYSNLGAGLLGHALAGRAGTTYERLLTTRVLAPLGMRATCITVTPALKARFAIGHTSIGYPAEYWDLGALAGAGGLRSSVNDVLAFLAANMAPRGDRLGKAFGTMQAPRHDAGPRQAGGPEMSVGLGWHIRKTADGEIVWHNGGTYGFHAFMGFDRKRHVAVVVLHNSGTVIDDIGFHLIDAAIPLSGAKAGNATSRREVPVPPAALARYAGEYQLGPLAMTVTTDGGIFRVRLAGQTAVRAYPESETAFFLKVVDAQIEFTTDAGGAVTGVVLHQNGRDVVGKRK